MALAQRLLALLFCGFLTGAVKAAEGGVLPQSGSYEVEVRLEIPNVQNWTFTQTTMICVPNEAPADNAPFPVLSGNNPVAKCPASNLRRAGDVLTFCARGGTPPAQGRSIA